MLEELPVRPAAHLTRDRPPRDPPSPLGFPQIKGRLVELTQEQGSASLSFLCTRIREAQTLGESVVWVHTGGSLFFPPDFAANGVDLTSLTVVCAPDIRFALRAVHHLLHSGAFGMVVLDGGDEGPAMDASRILGRFAHLAEKNDTALVCLPGPGRENGMGSMISLRVRTRLHRLEPGLFRCDVDVVKDKRRGPGLRASEIYHAPAGLR